MEVPIEVSISTKDSLINMVKGVGFEFRRS